MSRKGNCLDNAVMENFFGLLKSEMFYEQEEKYKTLEELKEAIEDYIYYYNNKRIKEKLFRKRETWEQNLFVLWFGTFMAGIGFSLVMPFMSLYIDTLYRLN